MSQFAQKRAILRQKRLKLSYIFNAVPTPVPTPSYRDELPVKNCHLAGEGAVQGTDGIHIGAELRRPGGWQCSGQRIRLGANEYQRMAGSRSGKKATEQPIFTRHIPNTGQEMAYKIAQICRIIGVP